MNQDNYYAPGKLYNTQTGNIKSINDQLVFEEQLVLDVLPESIDNTFGLVVDEANQVFKQEIQDPGTGDVEGPAVSFVNGIASFLDGTGKVITSKNGPTIDKLDVGHLYESVMYRGDGAHLSKKSIGFNMPYPPNPTLTITTHGINTNTFSSDTSSLISYGYGCFLNGTQTMISNWTQPTIYASNFSNGLFSLKKRDNCLPFNSYDYLSDFDTIWEMSPNIDNIRYGTEIVANGGLTSKVNNNFDDSTTTFLNANLNFTGSTVLGLNFVEGPVSSTNTGLCTFNGTTGEIIQSPIGTLSNTGTLDVTEITTGIITLDPAGTLTSQNVNNFQNSTTTFNNSTLIDFTAANIVGTPFVEGPVSSVDNGICTFNGTDGSAIQTSNFQIVGTTMSANGNIDSVGTLTSNAVNTTGLTINALGGVLNSGVTNNFQTSITNFNDSTIDFTNAITIGLDRVQFVGTSPVLGQIPYYDDNTGQKINNSGILINGLNDLTNINGLSCTAINTGQGLVECYAMDQPVRTTDNVSFNTIDNNRIKPQQISKVGIIDITDPNRITLETDNSGVGLPWEVWSLLDNKDDTYMGFDISSGGTSNNYKPNSDMQILYHKTNLGLDIYGGNNLKSNGNIQITDLSKLLTYGSNGIDFHASCDFELGVTTNASVRVQNLPDAPTNTRFVTLDAFDYLENKTIIPVYGGMYFQDNLTTTPLPTLNLFTLFGSLFTALPDFTGITFPTQAITILEACKLDLNCSISLESQSATFIQYEFCLFKNGSPIPGSCRKTSTTDSNEDKNLECSSIVSVLPNDVLDVRVRNITNTTAILITNCCFKVVRIFE